MGKQTVQHLYFRRATRVALVLAGLPFVRFVGLTGSVARGTAHEGSDIDFFIVANPGRLFTVRLLVSLFVHLFGLRRHGQKISGRICLNRYQTTDALEILPHNRYHAQDLSQLIPLVDLDHIYDQFRLANRWMAQDFGSDFPAHKHRPSRSLRFSQLTRRPLEWLLAGWLGEWLEVKTKASQTKKIAANPLTSQYPESIQVLDTRLTFHPPGPGETNDDLTRWDAAAAAYDLRQGRFGDPFRRLLIDPVLFNLLGDVRGQIILDAGCGNGYLTEKLAEKGATVIGIDGAPLMVARAQKNFPSRHFEVANLAVSLPFANQQFDVVIANMVIHSLGEPATALSEFHRLLKPTGRLFLTLPHPAFAYPVGVTRRDLLSLLARRPATMSVSNYLTSRSVAVPMEGLTLPTLRYHRPLTIYANLIREANFQINRLVEPAPSASKGQLAKQVLAVPDIPLILVFELRPS